MELRLCDMASPKSKPLPPSSLSSVAALGAGLSDAMLELSQDKLLWREMLRSSEHWRTLDTS